ncbi:hypothetical protein BJV82DRAFT_7339 [Fennellomyces sp. T-0311]|nr:hypothetical protein BJV82DRAFT_7339 [Fennellomyces sp. T-0311]
MDEDAGTGFFSTLIPNTQMLCDGRKKNRASILNDRRRIANAYLFAEICRVCRCGGTSEQPLFHPCKCSGSIRHVHQDCLTEWLSHSRKKYCELCEHPFSFTPVYRPDMPESLPLTLFITQLHQKIMFLARATVRCIIVSLVWLVILPYLTVWTWRFYLWSGENMAFKLSRLQDSNATDTSEPSITLFPPSANVEKLLENFSAKAFLADCFEGQVITCIVVIAFVAAFLLREWIIQNIPAELEEEEEEQVDELDTAVNDALDRRREAIYDLQQTELRNSNNDNDRDENDDDYPKPSSSSASSSLHTHQSLEVDYLHTSGQSSEGDTTDTEALPTARGEPPNAPIMRHVDHHFDVRGQFQRRGMLFEEQVNDMMHEEQGLAVQQPNEDQENDDNEIDEENFGDDIDGILEAIGMRGNYWMLAQNSALMALLISLCLGAAVWLPYVIGIVFLMANPFKVVNYMLWLVRKVTDPLLDYVFLICSHHIWPIISNVFAMHALYDKHVPPETAEYIHNMVFQASSSLDQLFLHLSPTHNDLSAATLSEPTSVFATRAKAIIDSALTRYQHLAMGKTTFDRFICVLIGYAVIFAISSWYLSRTHVAYATFGRSARHVLRQQGIILKVAMFIAIELLLFPIVCGVLLDLSSLSLFRDATVDSRFVYLQTHPLASIFLHWFLGTAFMFFFAILVTVCREIVRPGVLWFIRDPNDPQFHPIKEIVERPVLTQLQKIGASGVTYACVIVAGVGSIVWCLAFAGRSILPLRWNLLQPLSTLPIDFLIVHIVIPAMVQHFEPKRALKNLAIQWMRYLCHQLRLTSFMFGERIAGEEGVWYYKTWRAWLRPPAGLDPVISNCNEAVFMHDGQLVLAPKHDTVPFDPARRMLVPVDANTLQILDPTERRRGHPAAPNSGDLLANTVIVYTPPWFKERILLFLLSMWISSSIFICTLTVLPIALGRVAYERWLGAPGEVHDIYSYFVGAMLMVFGIVLLHKLADAVMDLARQRTFGAQLSRLYHYVSDSIYLASKAVYLGISFGMMVPLLLGLVVELYLIMPLEDYGLRAPTIEPVAMWTRGVACMSTMHGLIHLGPENPWRDHVNLLFQHNIRTINLREITAKLTLPIIGTGLTMAGLPLAMALVNIKLLGEQNAARQIKLIQIMYPAALIGLGVYYLCRIGAKFGRSWVQTVREENYLVGRILHNFE